MVWALLVHSCEFACQQRVWKTFPGPGYLRYEDRIVWRYHFLVNLYIFLTISSCYGSILFTLGLIGTYGVLSTLGSWLWVCLSGGGVKYFSWSWLFLLRRWGRLNMAFTGNFVYIANYFILLWFNPFHLKVVREGWWFEHPCVIVASLLVRRGS